MMQRWWMYIVTPEDIFFVEELRHRLQLFTMRECLQIEEHYCLLIQRKCKRILDFVNAESSRLEVVWLDNDAGKYGVKVIKR